MNKKQIERYFHTLSKLYHKKCKIILTGAAAGALYGRVRPTMDIDFSVEVLDWKGFSEAVEETSLRMGIVAQFSEDIDRWSSITLMDYKKHTYVFKRFGNIEVSLMDPAYWAIGKFTRYLDPDIQDLVKVFKATVTPWQRVATIAGRALRKSPKSTACFSFLRQTEHFFNHFGKKIWGKSFNSDEAIKVFRKSAKIKTKTG